MIGVAHPTALAQAQGEGKAQLGLTSSDPTRKITP